MSRTRPLAPPSRSILSAALALALVPACLPAAAQDRAEVESLRNTTQADRKSVV